MKLNKKGFTLNEVPALAIALLVVAIVIGISATVLTNMQGTSTMTDTGTRFDSNGSFVAINETTAVDFTDLTEWQYNGAGLSYLVPASCTGVNITNGSNVDVTSKFTVSNCMATLTENAINNTAMTANYTFTFTTYKINYNITQQGLQGQSDFSEWQSTWVVVLAAAVIIGIVGKYLFFK